MRILIADDHDLVRDTLCAFLEREADMQTLAVSSYAAVEEALDRGERFDLILLDFGMPGMDGLSGLTRCLAHDGAARVALISGVAPKAVAAEALAAGAAGFLPKTLSGKSLVNAVRFMASGEQYAPIDFMTAPEEAAPEHPLAAKLSERERQVLDGLVRGLANKEIAREIGLQEPTVKLHVKTLCRKLDARNRTHAAMIAKEEGIV